ncbi:TonB-dependent receptor [Sphingomonas sp.]|uniref:TonB-dependent receptor n=1 Tax=Sphingomonas sp. TaxID=28214 RepID=UPI002FC91CAE
MSIRAAHAFNLSTIVAAALWSTAVSAQGAAPDADPPAATPVGTPAEQTSDTGGIADIVVTAQKRAENIQDVPIAISAFSGETLEQANISSLEEVQGRTPGLVLNSFSPGQPEVAIRGVGTKEDGAGASDSTLVMVDGVYFATRTATNLDIFDLERLEVLRGPQGTLFGKNAIAGVINYVTRKPTLGEFELKVRQTVGNFGTFDTGAGVNVPIGDTVAARLSFSRRETDGYLTRVNVGTPAIPLGTEDDDDIGYADRFAWRAAVKWEPSDATSLLLSLDGANDDFGTDNREPVGSAGPLHNCLCASNPVAVNVAIGGTSGKNGGVYSYAGDTLGFSKRDIFGAMAQLDHDFGFATLTVLGAYRDSTFKNVLDSAGLPPSPIVDLTGAHGNPNIGLTAPANLGFTFDTIDIVDETGEQLTGEVRLTSPSSQRLKWVVGLYASHEDIDRTEGVGFPALSDASLVPSFGAANMFFTGKGIAGYGQASFDITDTLSVTGGARYSYEKKEIGVRNDVPGSPNLLLLLRPFALTKGEDSWKNFSWRISGQYRPTDDIMLYATVSTGFKSGGFTGTATTAETATTAFDPEEATNYEVGAKLDLFDRRLRLNTSAFYLDYSDLQVTRFFQPVGSTFGEFITENAANAEIKGIEVEMTARPVEWLELGGTYSYLDAKYKDFFGTPDITGTGDFSGNRMRQAPTNVWSAYAQLSHELPSGDVLTANVSGRHQGKVYTNADNNPLDVVGSYTLGDAWMSWRTANGKWELQAWVKNFTDEAYGTHTYTQRGNRIAFGTFGPPRQYGLTVTFEY